MIPDARFPKLLKFTSNKDYVRDVIKRTVTLTSHRDEYIDVSDMPKDSDFFRYQEAVTPSVSDVPSHAVITKYIKRNGEDYRYEDMPYPIESMRDRTRDNTTVGRQ